jgi:hypothetical protein
MGGLVFARGSVLTKACAIGWSATDLITTVACGKRMLWQRCRWRGFWGFGTNALIPRAKWFQLPRGFCAVALSGFPRSTAGPKVGRVALNGSSPRIRRSCEAGDDSSNEDHTARMPKDDSRRLDSSREKRRATAAKDTMCSCKARQTTHALARVRRRGAWTRHP